MSGVNTAGTKGVPRAASEAQLLDIAAEDIGRLGYAGLSVGEVAAGAGVSKPLVYGYFGSKDGLYVACVQRAASVLVQAIEEAISGPANLQMAERTLEAIFSALQPRPHDWNVLFDRSHPPSGPVADASGRRAHRSSARPLGGPPRWPTLEASPTQTTCPRSPKPGPVWSPPSSTGGCATPAKALRL